MDHEPPQTNPEQLDLSKYDIPRETTEALISELYDRDLVPYSNDKVLERRLTNPNRTLRRAPGLNDRIRAALVATDDDSILDVVTQINEARRQYAPEREKPVNTILSYLTMALAIDTHKIALSGKEASTDRSNAISSLLAKAIAFDVPESQLIDTLLSSKYIVERIETMYEDDTSYSFFRAKANLLRSELSRHNMVSRYIDALPGQDTLPVSEEVARQDTTYVSQLFSAMTATQRYGVKPGYIADDRGGSLIFDAPIDIHAALPNMVNAHELITQMNMVAVVIHSRKRHHKKVQAEPINTEGTGLLSIDFMDPLAVMQLGSDGELYVDTQCTIPYVDIARTKGKYKAYRDLQATVLAHYFDLTHPIDDTAVRVRTALHNPSQDTQDGPLAAIQRLVIPRIHTQRSEQGQHNHQQPEETSRAIRRHDVIWHTRDLPKGWKASPQAQENARRLGVKLAENQTFVRDHKRGTLAVGQVAGHQYFKHPQN